MARRRNRYEAMTRVSLILAGLGGVMLLAAAAALLEKFNWHEFEIVLEWGGNRFLLILGGSGVAIVSSGVGFFVALSSIHRLNTQQKLAWISFAINAVLLALSLSEFLFFWFTKEPIRIKT